VLNKKRAFVSLGAGILIFVIASFVILLTWELLKKPELMSTVIVWIIGWPILLAVKVISIPYPGRSGVVFALLIGVMVDIAFLSGLIYAALSMFSRKARPTSPPPPPVPFH
jgi:hypothetical protein